MHLGDSLVDHSSTERRTLHAGQGIHDALQAPDIFHEDMALERLRRLIVESERLTILLSEELAGDVRYADHESG